MVEFGTNSDGCGPDYDSVVGGTWPNGTRSDSARMWCTLSELSLTEIFPFDDHAFFSSPLRHNCLHRYSSLSLYFVTDLSSVTLKAASSLRLYVKYLRPEARPKKNNH